MTKFPNLNRRGGVGVSGVDPPGICGAGGRYGWLSGGSSGLAPGLVHWWRGIPQRGRLVVLVARRTQSVTGTIWETRFCKKQKIFYFQFLFPFFFQIFKIPTLADVFGVVECLCACVERAVGGGGRRTTRTERGTTTAVGWNFLKSFYFTFSFLLCFKVYTLICHLFEKTVVDCKSSDSYFILVFFLFKQKL